MSLLLLAASRKFPKTMENYVNCFGTEHAQKLTPYWITNACEWDSKCDCLDRVVAVVLQRCSSAQLVSM